MDKKPRGKLINLIKISFAIWFLCILGVVGTIIYVVGIRKELFDKTPEIFALTLLGLILLGGLTFCLGSLGFVIYKVSGRSSSKKRPNILILSLKIFILFAILPLFFTWIILKPKETIAKIKTSGIRGLLKGFHFKLFLARIFALGITALVIMPVWVGGYLVAYTVVASQLGYITEGIPIVGTGSMYPTFPKGQGKDPKELAKQIVGTQGMFHYPNGLVFTGQRIFGHKIGRGDIVVFENEGTRKATKETTGHEGGFIKRVIAIAGDTIELRSGSVILNGKPQKEPYTASPHSTFGEEFLKECQTVIVPSNSFFAMGDNRKGSGDSRQIGFASINNIQYVLPWNSQKGTLDKNWRDASKDLEESSKVHLDVTGYIDLLNEKRKEARVKQLTLQAKLNGSAKLRGEAILKFDDFSFEATKSGYTMGRAMGDAGYSNITWGEVPTQGYYTAEELIENQFEFPLSKKFLLNNDYQEIGISEVEGQINSCPTQVIVQHFAGYVPPNYNQADIDSWKSSLAGLRQIQPSWADLKNNTKFYEQNKNDVDRINAIISQRITNITAIVSRMELNQWLSSAERSMTDQETALYQEQESIATRLNSR